ncbi:MAG: translation elongation factor Ts [Fibromonadaceae bacterium]|jgi:elongation factor Ts|nr:translation elongation factor Ts [Fibromonadaceae bacterium]
MAAITASMVNSLREKTGVGMMKCKEALTVCEGDIEKAIEYLRKQGADVALKRADKDAKEGSVFIGYSETKAFAFVLTCETDFVAKGEDFIKLGSDISAAIKASSAGTVEEVLNLPVGSITVKGRIDEVLAKIGEKIEIRKFAVVPIGANEVVAYYSHSDSHSIGKIGTIVKLAFEGSPNGGKEAVQAVAKTIALHVTMSNPVALTESDLQPELIEKEKGIALEQVKNEGKTKAEFLDRAVEGRLKKALKQLCLLEQAFYSDDKKTVSGILAEEQKKLGISSLSVAQFVRFEKGG